MYFIKKWSLMVVILTFPFTATVNIKYRKIDSTKTNSYYSTRDVASGAGCSGLCSQNNKCVSANFNKDTGACELNDDHGELESPLHHQPHWVMYHKTCDTADVKIGNQCIHHVTTKQTWTEAKEHCESIGYELAIIESWEEFKDNDKFSDGWVGGKCVDGTCRWMNGQVVNMVASHEIEINGCLNRFRSKKELHNHDCDEENYSFCSRKEFIC